MDQKQEFLGGLIGSILVKKGIDLAINKAIDQAAKSPTISLQKKDAAAVKQIVKLEVEDEVTAQVQHKTDTEPHYSSRNVIASFFGTMTELGIIYSMWTDDIPQTPEQYGAHVLILVGLLTPMYSRFWATKPLAWFGRSGG